MKTKQNIYWSWLLCSRVGCFTNNVTAQGQGGFDPVAFRQTQLDRYRDRLEVKSDDDWKNIEPLIGKVMDAQRDARMGVGGFGFPGGRGGRGGRGGGDAGVIKPIPTPIVIAAADIEPRNPGAAKSV